MSLFPVVSAVSEVITTVITWRVPHESMLERLIPLFVPLEVSDHLLFLDEDSGVTVEAVEVFSIIQGMTLT